MVANLASMVTDGLRPEESRAQAMSEGVLESGVSFVFERLGSLRYRQTTISTRQAMISVAHTKPPPATWQSAC
jgi:hypothetical protein